MRPLAAILLVLAIACEGDPGVVDPSPSGAMPFVEATLQFGDAPVEGVVALIPRETTSGWSFAIDLDEDGNADREGILGVARRGFEYRFDAPGNHAVRVELTGPDGTETVSVPVVVDRPSAIRVVAETRVEPLDPDARIFEGVAASRDGSLVFAGDFRGGDVHALDATTLEPRGVVEGLKGVEGLSVTPSGDYLFAILKYEGAVRLSLPDLVPDVVRGEYFWSGHYVYAPSDRTVLAGGGGDGVTTLDLQGEAPVARRSELKGHFDVDPAGERAVGMDYVPDPRVLRIVALPDLVEVGTVPLPPGSYPSRVVYGPSGDRVFALVSGGREPLGIGWTLYVLDAGSGAIERTISLDDGGCSPGLCAANPVARSSGGRYVAFETMRGVLVVDATTGLPVARGPQGSVAASPVEDATFFALQPEGMLRKFVVQP